MHALIDKASKQKITYQTGQGSQSTKMSAFFPIKETTKQKSKHMNFIFSMMFRLCLAIGIKFN